MGIAVFPGHGPTNHNGHASFRFRRLRVWFFVSIAYVCIWRAGDTFPLIKDETDKHPNWGHINTSVGRCDQAFAAWAVFQSCRVHVDNFGVSFVIYVFAIDAGRHEPRSSRQVSTRSALAWGAPNISEDEPLRPNLFT